MDRPDHFERLSEAISNLQDILCEMGPAVELSEIRLKPNRVGGFQFEMGLRASTSFLNLWTPDFDKDKPPEVLAVLQGVKITHVRT